MSETMLERAAKAMRERYAEHSGDHEIVPWERAKSREAWLLCARAALEAIKVVDVPDDHFSDSDWDWNHRVDQILSQSQEGK